MHPGDLTLKMWNAEMGNREPDILITLGNEKVWVTFERLQELKKQDEEGTLGKKLIVPDFTLEVRTKKLEEGYSISGDEDKEDDWI